MIGANGTNGVRPGVRFLRVELEYGQHSGIFNLDAGKKPLVIPCTDFGGGAVTSARRTSGGDRGPEARIAGGSLSRRPGAGGMSGVTSRPIW